MKLIKIAFVVSLALLLNACALTKTQKDIAYAPKVDASAKTAFAQAQTISVGKFVDSRGVEDPNVLFQKKNMYNNTMLGSYAAKRPVVDYVREGIEAYMRSAGIESADSKLVLSASLEEFADELQMGFWKSKLKTKMMVKFRLQDQTGKLVWNDTIVGKALIDKGDYVAQSLTLTSDDVARQLFADEGFQAALKQ